MSIAPITDAESIRQICSEVHRDLAGIGSPEKIYPQRGRGLVLFLGLGALAIGAAMGVVALLEFDREEASGIGIIGLFMAASGVYMILKARRRRYLVLTSEGFLDVRGTKVSPYRWDRVEAIFFAAAPDPWGREDASALVVTIRFRSLDPLRLVGSTWSDGQGLHGLDDFLDEACRRCPGVPIEIAR